MQTVDGEEVAFLPALCNDLRRYICGGPTDSVQGSVHHCGQAEITKLEGFATILVFVHLGYKTVMVMIHTKAAIVLNFKCILLLHGHIHNNSNHQENRPCVCA